MSKDGADHHKGLEQDLKTLARLTGRRQILRWMAGASLVPLFGCGGGKEPGDGNAACSKIPEETAGPYPGDGSNGANALALAGIVRGDIRSSIAGATGVAAGVPLKVTLTLVNSNNDCAPLAGYSGRWPHIHFEVYPSLGVAASSSQKIATSQLALPEASCAEAYAATGYSTSVNNLRQLTLASDNVFRDGVASQLASVTGNATDGYTATLIVGITR